MPKIDIYAEEPPPSWVGPWLSGVAQTNPYDEVGLRWMRSRPASVKESMIKFPPGCVVKITSMFNCCLKRGIYGIVSGYGEDEEGEGYLLLRGFPEMPLAFAHRIPLKDVELVGVHGPLTVDWVKEVLGVK